MESMLVTSNEIKLILRFRQLQNRKRSAIVLVEIGDGDCKGWYVTGKREGGDDCRKFFRRLKQLLDQHRPTIVVVEVSDGDCKRWYVAEKREGSTEG